MSATSRQWQPRPVVVVVSFAGTAALLGVALVASSQARVLAGAAAMLLGVETARSLRLRPALYADASGLRVLTGWRHRFVPWSSIVSVRADRAGRLFPTTVLEIDIGSTVLVLSGYQLGEPPGSVALALAAMRPRFERSGDEGT